MKKKAINIFNQLQIFEDEINRLESRILDLEQQLKIAVEVQRSHLIRVKNDEEVTDDFIFNGRKYLDLSPEKAWKVFQKKDFDFIVIDVSAEDYKGSRIPGSIHLPWEDFADRFLEVTNRTTPLIIISEDGTNSVLACEFLVSRGYFNCNNVSGGYKFWKGRLENMHERTA